MPLEPDRISVAGEVVTIDIGPEPTTSFNGIALRPGTTYVLRREEGGSATRSITEWVFDDAATPQNPITVQIEGVDLTLTVDPSIPQRVSQGEIIFQPVNRLWNMTEIPNALCVFDFSHAANLSTDPTWAFADETGTATLIPVGLDPHPVLDVEAGGLVYNGERAQFDGPEFPWNFNGGNTPSWFYASFVRVSNPGGRVFQSSNQFQYIALNENGRGLSVRRNSNSNVIWDGGLDVEGNPDKRFYTSGSGSAADIPYRHAVESTIIPANTPTFFMATWLSQGGANNRLEDLGFNNNASYVIRQAGVIKTVGDITTDIELRTQGRLAWDLAAEGFTTIDQLLPVNHPYRDGPPRLSGGGDAAITLLVPSVGITVTNIPEGATIVISQAGRTLEVFNGVTGGTYTYEIQEGESNTYHIKIIADGFDDFEQAVNIQEGLSSIYSGIPSDSSDKLSDSFAEFFNLMQSDAAFQTIASSAGSRILQQLWQNVEWQADWDAAVIAAAPSTAEISGWIGYVATSGFTAISFNPTTGEVA